MTILAPNASEFKAMLAAKKTFLADFYATWCGPCKMESYVLDDLDKIMGDKLDIVKIDIDKEPELTGELDITIVPTLLFIKTEKLHPVTAVSSLWKKYKLAWKSFLKMKLLWKLLLNLSTI